MNKPNWDKFKSSKLVIKRNHMDKGPKTEIKCNLKYLHLAIVNESEQTPEWIAVVFIESDLALPGNFSIK